MTDSFPFLHAARRLSLPYSDVLLFAECLIGIGDPKWKPTPHHIAAAERMTPDLQAQHVINAAWRNEADRRLNLNQDERVVLEVHVNHRDGSSEAWQRDWPRDTWIRNSNHRPGGPVGWRTE